MTAPSAQSGIHKPQEVFCLLNVALEGDEDDPDPFCGLILELATSAYITPQGSLYLPVQANKVGALKMFATDEFVEHLLDLPTVSDPSNYADEINVGLLKFEDILPSVVKVLGIDFDVGTLVAKSHEDTDMDALGDDDDDEDVGELPLGDGRAAESNSDFNTMEVDLLSLLEGSCCGKPNKGPAKKRQKKKEQNPDDMDRENNELTPDCQPESLLNDPCLRTLLSPEDLAVFQDVEQFCASVHKAADINEHRHAQDQVGGVDFGGGDSDSESDGDVLVDTGLSIDADAAPATCSQSQQGSSFTE